MATLDARRRLHETRSACSSHATPRSTSVDPARASGVTPPDVAARRRRPTTRFAARQLRMIYRSPRRRARRSPPCTFASSPLPPPVDTPRRPPRAARVVPNKNERSRGCRFLRLHADGEFESEFCLLSLDVQKPRWRRRHAPSVVAVGAVRRRLWGAARQNEEVVVRRRAGPSGRRDAAKSTTP